MKPRIRQKTDFWRNTYYLGASDFTPTIAHNEDGPFMTRAFCQLMTENGGITLREIGSSTLQRRIDKLQTDKWKAMFQDAGGYDAWSKKKENIMSAFPHPSLYSYQKSALPADVMSSQRDPTAAEYSRATNEMCVTVMEDTMERELSEWSLDFKE